jgi:FMN reductase
LNQTKDSVLVVALGGSLRATSYTRLALKLALEGAAEVGAQTHLIDLRDYQLVFCNSGDYPADVTRLRQAVQRAQGIILGTPEYHSSFSGVLKNALDLMGFDQFEGKMVGLVGVSGGQMGAAHALNSLRAIGRALHAWVIPEQASIPRAAQAFNPAGQLLDPALDERVRAVGRQVARFAFLHHSDKTQQFLSEWESAPLNPGGVNWSEE